MSGANPLKGEARIGDKLIRVDFDAVCRLEAATGRTVVELMADLGAGLGATAIRTWVGVLLVDEATSEEIDALLTEGGFQAGYERAMAAIVDAVNGFFAPPRKETRVRPRKAG